MKIRNIGDGIVDEVIYENLNGCQGLFFLKILHK